MADIATTTELDARIPEVWANMVLDYLSDSMGFIKRLDFDPDADEIQQYGDTINITAPGTFTAQDKTENAAVTLQKPSDTKISLVLNKWKEVTLSQSDLSRVFAKPKLLPKVTKGMANALIAQVAGDLVSLYSSAGLSVDATSGDVIEKINEARRKLVTSQTPMSADRVGVMSEYIIEDLLNNSKLNDASKSGSTAVLREGSVGRVSGFDFYEYQGVKTSGSPATYHSMMFNPDAILLVTRALPLDAEEMGGARQSAVTDPETGLTVRITMSYQAGFLAPQITCDILYGVKVLRANQIVDFQHNA